MPAHIWHPTLPGTVVTVPEESVWHHQEGGWINIEDQAPHWDEPAPAYAEMTKEQLVEALAARNLPKSGTKDELVARLEESDTASIPDVAPAQADDSPDDQIESG